MGLHQFDRPNQLLLRGCHNYGKQPALDVAAHSIPAILWHKTCISSRMLHCCLIMGAQTMSTNMTEERVKSRQGRPPRSNHFKSRSSADRTGQLPRPDLRQNTTIVRTTGRTSTPKFQPNSGQVRVDQRHATNPRSHFPRAKSEPVQRQTSGWFGSFYYRQTLEKSFVMFGFAVAITLVLLFGIDLITGWPFHQASKAYDIANIVCGMVLAYLSWDTCKGLQ